MISGISSTNGMSNYFHGNLQSIQREIDSLKKLLVNVKNDDKLSDVERTKKIRDLENKIKKLEDLKVELNQSCSKNLYDEDKQRNFENRRIDIFA